MRRGSPKAGQGLVELGIIVVLLLALTMGVIQFGHAFMVANMITHSARDGARLAASWGTRVTGSCGTLPTTLTTSGASNPVESLVRSELATVVGSTSGFTIAVCQGDSGAQACPGSFTPPTAPNCGNPATPVVIVNVQGCVPYLMNIFGLGTPCSGGARGFTVNRSVWFRDEKRG